MHLCKEKVSGGFPYPQRCRFSPHGRWYYIGCLYQGGGNPQPLTLTLCSPAHSQWGSLHVYLNMIRVVNNYFSVYFIQTDETTAVGQEMVDAIQQFNLVHFQQACTNRTTSESVYPFTNGLRPFRISEQVLNRNMEEILSGTFDKNQIQLHKIPCCNELCRAQTQMDKTSAPISPANFGPI